MVTSDHELLSHLSRGYWCYWHAQTVQELTWSLPLQMEIQLPSVVTFFTAFVSYSLTKRIKLKNKTLYLTYTSNGIFFSQSTYPLHLSNCFHCLSFSTTILTALWDLSTYSILSIESVWLQQWADIILYFLYCSSYCLFQETTYPPVCIFLFTHTHTIFLGIPLMMLRIIQACCVNTCCDGAFLSVLIRAFPLWM